jgi:hypothetical protein
MRTNQTAVLCLGLTIVLVTRLAEAQTQGTGVVRRDSTPSTTNERIMTVSVIHRQTKEPVPEVILGIRTTVKTEEGQKRDYREEKTDTQGQLRVQLPDARIERLSLYPKKDGFVPLFIMWQGTPTPPVLPKAFTIAMEPGTAIGGVVHNEQGEPIEGVAVGVHYQTADSKAAEGVYTDIMIHDAGSVDTKTDDCGRWCYNKVPANIDKNELRLFLKHPDYLSDRLRPGHIPLPITPQAPIDTLRDLSSVMVMKAGIDVKGKVTDKRGKPIAGAKIYDVEDYWWTSTKPVAESDSLGQFQLNTHPGTATWTVQAPGYAPTLKIVTVKASMRPVVIRLEAGSMITGEVTDQAGEPIEGARLTARSWRRQRGRLHLEAQTDTEGHFNLVDAPADKIDFDIGKEGYMLREKFTMKPGEYHYTIALRPTLKVRGTVIDAQTGRPVDTFTITNGFDHGGGRAPQWDKHSVQTFTGGHYEMEYMQAVFTYRIRIDAQGYRSVVSDGISPSAISENSMNLDFKLEKSTAAMGTVHSPDGTPLSDADVVIATHWLRITNGKLESRSSEHNRILHTGVDGRFRFQAPADPYVVLVLHERGYARVAQSEFTASPIITVSPWGRIEGILKIGSEPGSGKRVAFMPDAHREPQQPRIWYEYGIQTNEKGHFTFDKVLPDKGVVARLLPIHGRGARVSHSIPVEVTSGRTARVEIGGTGRPIIGKVVVPDIIKDQFDWQQIDQRIQIVSPNNPYRALALEIDENGSFRMEDVPAGEYDVTINAYRPSPDAPTFLGERIGVLSIPLKISPMPGGRSDEPLNLGALEINVEGKAALIPSLIGKPLPGLDGITVELLPTQARGKKMLVCFWDMSQRPSRRCVSRLTEQSDRLKQDGVIVVAVHAVEIDKGTLRAWVKENDLASPVGMLQGDTETIQFNWGVKALPWLILTDEKHLVTAEGFGMDELAELIE